MFYRLRNILGEDQLLKADISYVEPILQYEGFPFMRQQTKLK